MKYILSHLDSCPVDDIVINICLNKMFRDTDDYFTPREITDAITHITEPWDKVGLTPPNLSVIEVARTAQVSIKTVLETLLADRLPFQLQDTEGQKVDGNLREAAILSAPHKRVIHVAQRNGLTSEETAYRMGIGRLRLSAFSH